MRSENWTWYSYWAQTNSTNSPILWPIHGQICGGTQLIATNVFELLVLLAEPEVRVCGHDPVVLPKVLQLHWTRSLNHRVRKADLRWRKS